MCCTMRLPISRLCRINFAFGGRLPQYSKGWGMWRRPAPNLTQAFHAEPSACLGAVMVQTWCRAVPMSAPRRCNAAAIVHTEDQRSIHGSINCKRFATTNEAHRSHYGRSSAKLLRVNMEATSQLPFKRSLEQGVRADARAAGLMLEQGVRADARERLVPIMPSQERPPQGNRQGKIIGI